MRPRTLLPALCIGFAAGILAGPATAQERPPLPAWVGSIEAGLAAAKERGQALMVAVNMDNERGNQQMLDEVYTSDEVLAASKLCVPVVASLFDHGLEPDSKTGKRVCRRFGSVTCEQHRAVETIVRTKWLGRGPKDDIESPRHFFLAPNGKILFERVWTIDSSDLASMMKRASEICTPERLANWDSIEGRLERAADPTQSVRELALSSLIAENDALIDAALVKLAKKTKDPGVAGSVLGSFAAADTPERRKLAHDALSHRAPEVRMLVAYTMEKSGHADHLKPLLARAPKEKDEKAKGSMYRAIGVLAKADKDGKDDDKAKKVLLKAVGNGKDPARAHAAVAIAPWAKDKNVKAAMLKITLQGGSSSLRSAAAWVLGYSEDKGVIDDLKKMHESLSRWDWRVRRVVESAMDKLRGKDVSNYDSGPSMFLKHPAEGGDEDEDRRWPPGR